MTLRPTLSAEERAQLSEEPDVERLNDVSFDIRPGYLGRRYSSEGIFSPPVLSRHAPFCCTVTRRGPRECHVDKAPLTPDVAENPVYTMEMVRSDSSPSEADLANPVSGTYYAVRTDGPLARWNRDAFQLLYLLFQMTMTEVPRLGVPSITIAK